MYHLKETTQDPELENPEVTQSKLTTNPMPETLQRLHTARRKELFPNLSPAGGGTHMDHLHHLISHGEKSK